MQLPGRMPAQETRRGATATVAKGRRVHAPLRCQRPDNLTKATPWHSRSITAPSASAVGALRGEQRGGDREARTPPAGSIGGVHVRAPCSRQARPPDALEGLCPPDLNAAVEPTVFLSTPKQMLGGGLLSSFSVLNPTWPPGHCVHSIVLVTARFCMGRRCSPLVHPRPFARGHVPLCMHARQRRKLGKIAGPVNLCGSIGCRSLAMPAAATNSTPSSAPNARTGAARTSRLH